MLAAAGRRGASAAAAAAAALRGLRTSAAAPAPTTAPPQHLEHAEVVIALGSNQGNRVDSLLDALAALTQHAIEVLRVSLLYETAPMYVSEQAPFLNAAVLGRTDLSPLQLLYHLKQIEKQAGRDLVTGRRHGPRPLDLDIIFYGHNDMSHEALRIPHISWQDRAFVKAPMADLLLPEDIQRGYVAEPAPGASVVDRLLQAVQQWEGEGGEAQVGQPGLCRVLPIHRQIWELGHSTHICGVLNVTPDSFSDGGRYLPPRAGASPAGVVHSQVAGGSHAGGGALPQQPPQQPPPEQQRQEQQPAQAQGAAPQPAAAAAAPPGPAAGGGGAPPAPGPLAAGYPASVTGSADVDVAGAVEAARAMARAGAAMIDVGGQSTRPGSARLGSEEELARVIPVIRALREDSELVHLPVSVDTYHAAVAEAAVACGADMVNDVTGGRHDPRMFAAAAALGVPYCLTHMRGDLGTMGAPSHTAYGCVWREVGAELRASAAAAVAAGVLPWNLVLDPGLGFAKTSEGSAELLGHLGAMRREVLRGVWGRMPLLVGPSRKRFIGKLTGRHVPAERDLGTAAACVAAVAQGADVVRVHNVPLVAEALRVADGVLRGAWPPAARPIATTRLRRAAAGASPDRVLRSCSPSRAMPELPEVEAARKLVATHAVGRTITAVAALDDAKIFCGATPSQLADALTGKRLAAAGRKGKQAWLALAGGGGLLMHFGMTGFIAIKEMASGRVHSVAYENAPQGDGAAWPPRFHKLLLRLGPAGGGAADVELAYCDARRFGKLQLVQAGDPAASESVAKLGFDPLLAMPPLEEFRALLARRRSARLKPLLLDQVGWRGRDERAARACLRATDSLPPPPPPPPSPPPPRQAFCAGVGNWLADEVLWAARLHPEQPVAALGAEHVVALHAALRDVVATAVAVDADSARFPADWMFHVRWGKQAGKLAGHAIDHITVGSRTSCFVPALQKLVGGGGAAAAAKPMAAGGRGRAKPTAAAAASSDDGEASDSGSGSSSDDGEEGSSGGGSGSDAEEVAPAPRVRRGARGGAAARGGGVAKRGRAGASGGREDNGGAAKRARVAPPRDRAARRRWRNCPL
ncbi:FPG1 [Scenedesmus sp. PABB004]|nr:FPG1 [Scenedesmus sp. PABB004]